MLNKGSVNRCVFVLRVKRLNVYQPVYQPGVTRSIIVIIITTTTITSLLYFLLLLLS
jgi:hypothetical protein